MTRPASVRLRRSLASGLATLTLVALAGCGGGDSATTASDDSSPSTSASTSETTEPPSEAPSGAVSDSAASDSPKAGTELSADEFSSILTDALDQATTANVRLETGPAVDMKGQVDFTSDPSSARMSGEIAQAGALEVILVDNVIYMQSKAFGTGDTWLKLDLDDPKSPLGALGGQLDPASSLEKLVGAIKAATYVGAEEIDGDTLDHYTAVIDTKAMLSGLPAEAAGAAGLPATVDYQVWFDLDGFVRKFSVDLGSAGTSTGTFSDWGTEVDIAAPRPRTSPRCRRCSAPPRVSTAVTRRPGYRNTCPGRGRWRWCRCELWGSRRSSTWWTPRRARSRRGRARRSELLRAAQWRAARHGVSDRLLDPATGEPEQAPLVLAGLVAAVCDPLDAAGETDAVLEGVRRVLASSGASRQRAAHARDGAMSGVVDDLVERTNQAWRA